MRDAEKFTSDLEPFLPEDAMSGLLKGFKILFVPNNRAGITKIRQDLARRNGALINAQFRTPPHKHTTTHVLVDTKIILYGSQVLKRLEEAGVTAARLDNVPVLSQNWLVDSMQKEQLMDYEEYKIDLSQRPPSSASPSPKRRKVIDALPSKSQQLEDSIDIAAFNDNPNRATIDVLTQMVDQRQVQGEVFKVKAYKNAIDSLSKTMVHVTTFDQAMKLPGVGKNIAEKIEEISQTSGLEALKQLQKSKHSTLMRLFKGIHGVGNVIAEQWIGEGMETLDDVKERDDLSTNQRLGLQYYDEWTERIPRDECTVHNQYVLDVLKEIDSEVEATIGGSYRRGSKTCGDVDFILTRPGASIEDMRIILDKLLEKTKESGYWKCSLTQLVSNKWLGGCALPPKYNKRVTGETKPGKCRRVDYLLVAWENRGAAFIYYTGNDEFNKKIRLRALKRGMILNGEGLYKQTADKKAGELIESFSERKIFEILGVHYVEPTARNIGSQNID